MILLNLPELFISADGPRIRNAKDIRGVYTFATLDVPIRQVNSSLRDCNGLSR